MSDQRLYVNSKLMKKNGDDTKFTLSLGNRYTFKRMVLNAFMCDNLFQNFYDDYTDFSYQYNIGGLDITQSLTIDSFILQAQFLTWFNANAVGITLQDNPAGPPTYEYRLSYQTVNNAHTWKPIGKGWSKLGFNITTAVLARTQTATKLYDFTQSPTVLIGFRNVKNAHTSDYGQFTFQIENNSSFAGKIMKVFQNVATNQQLLLNQSQTINELDITLYNCDMKQIKTVNGNNNDIECILNISLFDE